MASATHNRRFKNGGVHPDQDRHAYFKRKHLLLDIFDSIF